MVFEMLCEYETRRMYAESISASGIEIERNIKCVSYKVFGDEL